MMNKQGAMALAVVAIVAAVGLVMVFSTDSNGSIVGYAVESTLSGDPLITDLGGQEGIDVGETALASTDVSDAPLVSTSPTIDLGDTAGEGVSSDTSIVAECLDPDGKYGYYTKTRVTQPGQASKWDRCLADGRLQEAYCGVDKPRRRAVPCPKTMVCNDGACVEPTVTASEYVTEEVPAMPACATCPSNLPVWVEGYASTGNELCAREHSGCLAAEHTTQTEYFATNDGVTCGSLQLLIRTTKTKACDVMRSGHTRCMAWSGGTGETALLGGPGALEPRAGDWKTFTRITGAWCIP